MHYRILTPNELDLSFPAPNDCAKFHQILFKIATVGAMTDRHTDTQTHRQTDASDLIICPMLCNSNGTDNKLPEETRNFCDNYLFLNTVFLLLAQNGVSLSISLGTPIVY